MNLRNLFRVTAVFLLIIGLFWLLAPKATPDSLGIESNPYALYLVRVLGTYNISLAVLAFFVSGMAHSPTRQAVVTVFILQQLLSRIMNIIAVIGGGVPGASVLPGAGLNFLFALAFAYFHFVRPEATVTPGLQS
ncbi:MAG: hypothetical protein WAM60_13940 [Candidatus Promineifilaceae bacterium]